MQELGAGLAVPPQAGGGPRGSLLCRLVPEWPWWLERAVNQPAWTSVSFRPWRLHSSAGKGGISGLPHPVETEVQEVGRDFSQVTQLSMVGSRSEACTFSCQQSNLVLVITPYQ